MCLASVASLVGSFEGTNWMLMMLSSVSPPQEARVPAPTARTERTATATNFDFFMVSPFSESIKWTMSALTLIMPVTRENKELKESDFRKKTFAARP